jgi:ABC-type transport system substrate-binding protein
METLAVYKTQFEALQQYLTAVGIKTTINVIDFGPWVDGNFGAPEKRPGLWGYVVNWDTNYDASNIYKWFSSDTAPDKGRKWNDTGFDQAYQKAKVIVDPDQRAAAFRDVGKIFNDTAQVVPLFTDAFVGATAKDVSMGNMGRFVAGAADLWIRGVTRKS